MEKGAQVWCRDPDPSGDDAWVLAEVVSKSPSEIKLSAVADPSVSIVRRRYVEEEKKGDGEDDGPAEVKYDGVELANAPLSDQDIAEGLDNDLISLPHLHEPALLHAIHERFNRGSIYTYTGPVIIAVNPFQRLPLYTEKLLEMYRRDGLLRSQNFQPKKKLPPHVYSIADLSYRQMMKAGKDGASGGRTNHKSQSILISGESGAGKTETTKIVMLYLTTLGSSLTPNQDEAKAGDEQKTDLSVMERVLQSNPILEAFGNARTLRNDNSSRFGKLIELGFSRAGVLLGAKVQTYLLEKVRVGFHASGERNYHIFYQLVRGSSTEDMHKIYNFHEGVTGGLEFCNHLHFTGQGGAPLLREFTDEDGLQYTLKAMRSMGWPEEQIDGVLKLVAGLLHLGQVTFEAAEDEHGQDISLIADESMIEHAAILLGVDVGNLKTALIERAVMARGETIMSPLPPAKALDARDALAKTIYGALFLWVVDQVNKSIGWESDADVKSSIGVLDIFGFECFAVNSFEQLCINFTNEALQQQFNKFIFKMEQAEYEAEKIEWAFISFPDNQDCLDLIQARPNGLLPQLDDECRLGQRGSDRNWANRLYKTFIPKGEESDNRRFKATAMQKGKGLFCVRHFAGLVTYTSETGFLEKNKDEVALTAKSMFESAPSQLIRDVFAVQVRESTEKQAAKPADGAGAPGGRSKPAKSKTVGTQFKEQLASLMERVESTEPHYIRCLKPNDTAKPKVLTRKRVTEQLRYGGVLEAVRVARMGYPVRMDHASFFQRYRMLLPSTPSETLSWSLGETGEEPQKLCITLVDMLLEETPEEELGRGRAAKIRAMQTQPPPMKFPRADVQLGLTKIFMRKPPHDILEAHRVYHQSASATQLQAFVRGMKECRIHLVRLSAARFVQRFYRGCVGRARWWRLREAQAAQLLTNDFRMQYYRHRYVRARAGSVRLQAGYRGFFLRRNLAACKVQTHVRMRTRRDAYRNLRSAIISLQCLERLRVAQAAFAELKREQKDIGKLKENNEKMKAEMAGLKAMLAALAKGEESKRETQGELKEKEEKIVALEKRVAELEAAIEKEKAIVARLEKELEHLRQNPPPARQPQQQQHRHHPQAASSRPQHQRTYSAGGIENVSRMSNVASVEASEANAELIAEHKAHISRLEEELEAERKSHREADGEIIKLRAEINGVRLNETEVEALLAPVDGKVSDEPPSPEATARSLKLDEEDEEESESEESGSESVSGEEEEEEEEEGEGPPEVTGAEEKKERMPKEESDAPIPLPARPAPASPSPKRPETPRSPSARKVVEKPAETLSAKMEKALEKPFFTRSPSDYFPLVRRGFTSATDDEEKEEEEVMAVGWQVEITSRKEREEALRDEVRRYEIKMKRFQRTLEEGVDVTLWQLNRNHGGSQDDFDEFALKATPVTLKLHKKGDLIVQTILKFNTRGGYLSKALGRGQKSALDPLPVHEILEIKAGCSGFDQTMLPAAKSGHKFKKSAENKHSSLFLTLKAAPNPLASLSRSYFLRFKSRSARNDLMSGLRGLLADLQIHEGIGISSIQTPGARSPSRRRLPDANFAAAHNEPMENGGLPHGPVDVMIPLADVHREMNKERQNYDRLLLQMLQSNSDLKEKEDELLILRGRLDAAADDIAEKEKVQANDSKLIMQLSKKLEMLLMDNEDLRDQNDRLNGRLVAVECEKMNIMSTMQS